MKRTKRIMALLLAGAMAFGQIPAAAWASETPTANSAATTTSGVLGTDKGTIKVGNAQAGETYSLYRLFELASFVDTSTQTSQDHGTNDQAEAYSYVINNDGSNPWYTFLTGYGPQGEFTGTASTTNYKYAVLSNETNQTLKENAYFIIDADPITIKGADGTTDVSTYHVVRANTSVFSNAWDDTSGATSRTDEGASVGVDYTQDSSPKYGVIQRFAQEALAYAEAHTLPRATNASGTAATDVTPTADGEVTLLENAPLGYYLVGTTMGTLASLDTTNTDVDGSIVLTILEKNDEPKIEKNVLDKSTTTSGTPAGAETVAQLVTNDKWVQDTDADVGDYVQFRTVVTVEQGADSYEIHDVMEDGLTYVADGTSISTNGPQDRYALESGVTAYNTKVYLYRPPANGSGEGTLYTIAKEPENGHPNYVLREGTSTSDSCTFEIEFLDYDGDTTDHKTTLKAVTVGSSPSTDIVDLKDGDQIIVTYWAYVNDNAVVYDNVEDAGEKTAIKDSKSNVIAEAGQASNVKSDKRNTNQTILTYGAKSYTTWADATVTTYQFDVVKTNAYDDSATSSLLEGAHFSLFKAHAKVEGENTTGATVHTINGTQYVVEGGKLTFTNTDNTYLYNKSATLTDIVSSKDAAMHLEGLEAWTYVLVEDTAPGGYNKLAHPILIEVNDDNDSIGTTEQADEGHIRTTFTNNSGTATVAPTTGFASPDAIVTNGTNHATYTKNAQQGGLQVVNQTGQELPSTGGIGTTVFYVAGGVLLAVSVVALITKRRMASEA